jgi:hypothetical protein
LTAIAGLADLSDHVDGIAAIDLFVLPTISFRLLYCLVILRHGVSFEATTNPTAEWISRQITEAFPWDSVHLVILFGTGTLRMARSSARWTGMLRTRRVAGLALGRRCADDAERGSRLQAGDAP